MLRTALLCLERKYQHIPAPLAPSGYCPLYIVKIEDVNIINDYILDNNACVICIREYQRAASSDPSSVESERYCTIKKKDVLYL